MRKFVFSLFLVCFATAGAKVRLPAIIGDGMVLQQRSAVKLWGWSVPGAVVRVSTSWNGKTIEAWPDKDGRFETTVNTPSGSFTRHSITFSEGLDADVKREETVVNNVLIGEVWLASGQSNIEITMGAKRLPMDGFLEEMVYAGQYDGTIREFHVPIKYALEPQDDAHTEWTEANAETLPDFVATSWYFASALRVTLKVPVGILHAAYGGTMIQNWMSLESLRANHPEEDSSDESMRNCFENDKRKWFPTGMYNGMICPLIPYTIRGFIWYQGEANTDDNWHNYAALMKTMVTQWRQAFGNDKLPFYFVEITPLATDVNQAYLREQQYRAYKSIDNVGMVCTNDLMEEYEHNNSHPRRKKDIGVRLAAWALNQIYGMDWIPCRSPEYKSMAVKGSKAIITLETYGGGINLRDTYNEGFEVAGDDRVFHPADDVKVKGDVLEISAKTVKHPVAVRYCFQEFQMGKISGYGELPLIPFRTDDW